MLRSGLRERVSDRVLTSIFQTRYKSGQRLIVHRLSEQFGVSPTPVRESLVELAGLGMVALLPNRGAVVKPFGREELAQMSQVRRVLESEAVGCACGRIDTATLKDLQQQLSELQSKKLDGRRDRAARRVDNSLHELIADGCGNPRLAGEVRRYLTLFHALRNVSHSRDSHSDYRHSDDVPEHLNILRPLLAGDADAASAAMGRHIRSVEKTIAEVMFPETPGNKSRAKPVLKGPKTKERR